jgi:serine phosphatase RsbU (regulator of sigma subunit)
LTTKPTDPEFNSPAFRGALRKSERFRILVVLGALGFFFVERSIRTALLHTGEDVKLWAMAVVVLACFTAYELAMLYLLGHATRTGRRLPRSLWIGSIVFETTLPAFGIAFLTSRVVSPEYKALANPLGLGFFIFIILSTLRLNPADSWIAGVTSAVSYLVAAWHVGWRPDFGAGSSILSPSRSVLGYAVALLLAGFAAAAVANEIRKHVNAALREAETQREVERLQHDLDVARSIQQSLLPSEAPQFDGFEIAGWNLPADETGGDFFDWQFLPGGKLMVALADVTGHGIGPALLASVCRAYARANFSMDGHLLPAMERINAAIGTDLTQGRFVTFVAAICTPESSRVELLSAGHGPLFIYLIHEDRFTKMNAQGLPLGVSPLLISDPPVVLEMQSGDMLLLITDGFFEWVNPEKEQFGVERMEEVIRKTKQLPPNQIIDALYQAVLRHSKATPQKDDLTAVIIKRT